MQFQGIPVEGYKHVICLRRLSRHTGVSRCLQCHIIAGSANNQCLIEEHGEALRQHGMVYAPDFVINAGGLLNVAMELAPEGYNEARVLEYVRQTADTVYTIFDTAARRDIFTYRVAIRLAKHKLAMVRQARVHGLSEPQTPRLASRG